MAMTLGKLRELTKDLGDDVLVIAPSSNYEMHGSKVSAVAYKGKYKKVTRSFRDDFDGYGYNAEVYEPDAKEGEDVFVISGT